MHTRRKKYSEKPANEGAGAHGLRERQQQHRSREIRKVARNLFRKHGYSRTTVEMIAELSFVSPPTVYNYFGTKGALLLSIIAEADRMAVKRSESSIRNPTKSSEIEITNLLVLLVKESLHAIDEATWRHAYAMTITDAGNSVGSGYQELNSRLYDVIEKLLVTLASQGKLSPEANIPVLRGLLERLNHAMFAEIVAEGGITFEQYRDQLLPAYVREVIGQYT